MSQQIYKERERERSLSLTYTRKERRRSWKRENRREKIGRVKPITYIYKECHLRIRGTKAENELEDRNEKIERIKET